MCASNRPSAEVDSRADATVLSSRNPWRRYGTGCDGAATSLFQGADPYAAATLAAGQDESSKPGRSQPSGTVWAALNEASVTTSRGAAPERSTCSFPMTPAGPSVVFFASIAMVFTPGCSADVTSASRLCFQESVVSGEDVILVPLTHSVKTSSAVSVYLPAVIAPEPRSTVRRRWRVATGALEAGSPSGYQTHWAPVRLGAVPGLPIHRAVQSWAFRPVSKKDLALQADARPPASQTRTRQK